MKIRFVTNACMEIYTPAVRILCDPWLVGKAFDGSWWQWPPLRLTPEDFNQYTHLYVSHIHSDHCDPHTLRRLPNKEAPVIILKGPDGFLRKRIASCGFRNFIELADGESTTIDGVSVTMHEAFAPNPFIDVEVPNIIDSSIVVDDGTYRFINLNDNTPDEAACRTLKQRYGHFDAATLPYSGVGPYPSSYANFSAQEKRMASDRKSGQYLDRMIAVAKLLGANVYFPAAGQMRLGGRQAHKNECLGVATQAAATDLLRKNGFRAVHLNEGDEFDLASGDHRKLLPPAPETDPGMEEHRYWWEDAFRVPPEERIELLPLLQSARQRLGNHQRKYRFTDDWFMVIRIEELPDRLYGFSFADPDSPLRTLQPSDLAGRKRLTVVVPYNYLLAILLRHCHWNNAYHGCQVEWIREPDDYVPELQTLLSYFHL